MSACLRYRPAVLACTPKLIPMSLTDLPARWSCIASPISTLIKSGVAMGCPRPIDVVQHGGSVDLKLGSQGVDGHARLVGGKQLMYLLEGQSALFSTRWDSGKIRLHGILCRGNYLVRVGVPQVETLQPGLDYKVRLCPVASTRCQNHTGRDHVGERAGCVRDERAYDLPF